jgi:hypothetical protein
MLSEAILLQRLEQRNPTSLPAIGYCAPHCSGYNGACRVPTAFRSQAHSAMVWRGIHVSPLRVLLGVKVGAFPTAPLQRLLAPRRGASAVLSARLDAARPGCFPKRWTKYSKWILNEPRVGDGVASLLPPRETRVPGESVDTVILQVVTVRALQRAGA